MNNIDRDGAVSIADQYLRNEGLGDYKTGAAQFIGGGWQVPVHDSTFKGFLTVDKRTGRVTPDNRIKTLRKYRP